MKTLSIFSRKALLLAVAAVTFALPGRAQLIQNTYLNVDWQVTVPLGSAFADKASGWGMNFEGGYFVTPEITVGAFISYQTNIESIGRQTLQLGSGAAMTTAQKHTLFELPFGVVGRYNFLKGSVFQPYAGLRIGADYAEMSSYYYTIQQYQDTWGVYLSPEIGVSIFPSPAQRFGFHVALFYSYASNNDDLLIYTMNNINRFYAHESCGQCTPCREGCPWMMKLSTRILEGKAAPSDVDLLIEVANQIEGKTVCAFGEAASWPTQAMVSKFKEEFVALTDPFNACLPHTEEGREQNRFLTR